MFEIIEKSNDTLFSLMDVRFKSLRSQTYFDKIDTDAEVIGYIKVSDFPSIMMRIVKSSEKMLDWWKENGTHPDNPPYPYIAEVASELYVRDNSAYSDDKFYADVIFAKTEEELFKYISEAIDGYKTSVSKSYCGNCGIRKIS